MAYILKSSKVQQYQNIANVETRRLYWKYIQAAQLVLVADLRIVEKRSLAEDDALQMSF